MTEEKKVSSPISSPFSLVPFEMKHVMDMRGGWLEDREFIICTYRECHSIGYSLFHVDTYVGSGGMDILEDCGILWLISSPHLSSFPKTVFRVVSTTIPLIVQEAKKLGVKKVNAAVESGSDKSIDFACRLGLLPLYSSPPILDGSILYNLFTLEVK